VDAAFLRQILAHPFDDGPRLVWADALDERGDPRGEFVRVQCELATKHPAHCRRPDIAEEDWHRRSNPGCRGCALLRRERELLLRHWRGWTPEWQPGSTCEVALLSGCEFKGTPLVEFRRGLVGSVTMTCQQFLGGPCGRCGGSGYVLDEEAAAYNEQIGRHPMIPPAMPCPDCRGTGRTEGQAAALFAAAPVTEVRLSDREPLRIFDGWGFSRGSDGTRRPEMTRHVIPPEVFDLIPTARDHLDEHPDAGWIRSRNVVTDAPEELLFLTPDRAHAALSVACVAYGRSSVHPPAAESKR
jgi:uncharacterized protein (TIGR02996 family)